MDINEFLILEKRISQIVTNLELVFSFDVIKTQHAEHRSYSNARGSETSNIRSISNREMSEFINNFRREIAEHIIWGEIIDGSNFVLRNRESDLEMVLVANRQPESEYYWKLVIRTITLKSDKISRIKEFDGELVIQK
jgi:hypothetical protein